MGTGREKGKSRKRWMGTKKKEDGKWEKKRQELGENGKKTAGKDFFESGKGKVRTGRKRD